MSRFLSPRTNTTLMDFERADLWHVAGYGVAVMLGIEFTFFNHLFVQSELKGGYINMPDVSTTARASDSANQQFWLLQRNIVIGGRWKFDFKKVSK